MIRSIRSFSSDLASVIRGIGPIKVESRAHQSLGYFLSRSVIGQQLSTHAAQRIWARIELAAANRSKVIPGFFHPQTAPLLRRCGVSSNKVRTLQNIRAAHNEGLLCSEDVCDMEPCTRSRYLQRIWGIGPWTCDMVGIFFCGDPDIWPEDDVSVQNTLGKFVGGKTPIVAERCSPYRSTLALYMWRILDAKRKTERK